MKRLSPSFRAALVAGGVAEELGLKLENATLKVTRPQIRPERRAERT